MVIFVVFDFVTSLLARKHSDEKEANPLNANVKQSKEERKDFLYARAS